MVLYDFLLYNINDYSSYYFYCYILFQNLKNHKIFTLIKRV